MRYRVLSQGSLELNAMTSPGLHTAAVSLDRASDPLVEGQNHTWHALTRATGAEGHQWVTRYEQPPISCLRSDIRRALDLLRRRQISPGRTLLDEVQRAVEPLLEDSPALFHVLQRLHAAAFAYVHYLEGDLESAQATLDRAQEHAEAALSRQPILLPLAEMCPELHFQHMRIARRRRDWDGMGRRASLLRGMMEDRLPLCRLEDGTEVRFRTLRDFVDGLEAHRLAELPPVARASFASVLDPQARLRRFELLVGQLYALPGFVIKGI